MHNWKKVFLNLNNILMQSGILSGLSLIYSHNDPYLNKKYRFFLFSFKHCYRWVVVHSQTLLLWHWFLLKRMFLAPVLGFVGDVGFPNSTLNLINLYSVFKMINPRSKYGFYDPPLQWPRSYQDYCTYCHELDLDIRALKWIPSYHFAHLI